MDIQTILALDPSSTCTGYAVMGWEDYGLRDAGKFKPQDSTAPAVERIDDMCDDLQLVLMECRPEIIVIEWTSGKIAGRLEETKISHLAIYGIAIGALWREVHRYCKDENGALRKANEPTIGYVLIPENEWTKKVAKRNRLVNIERLYPGYSMDDDKGGDVGDAIGLGRYLIINLQCNPVHVGKSIERP
jgi:hypothetical protein